jgi:predicted ATP-grasp superfamily ATP-dependent carboligase
MAGRTVRRVLLTDAWTRKALSAVRSLGTVGVEVHAVTHKRLSPAIYSKYVHRSHVLCDPSKEPDAYLDEIDGLLRSERFECLMPFEEASIELFLSARDSIEKHTVLPLPAAEAFRKANDKWEVLQLATAIGVPAPRTFLPASEQEAEAAMKELGLPLIIKPVAGSGSRGLNKVVSEEEFGHLYRAAAERHGRLLVQEYIPSEGQGMGVGVLADQGAVLVDFSYKRLREFPVNGGPSTLRESTDDPQLKEYAAKVVQALAWDGVAMVEFKLDPRDGLPKLIEVNPRFWGALDLAWVSGVNFPDLLLKWSTGEPISQPRYRTGVRGRWLLPGDVAHFLANPDRFKLRPSFFRFFEPDTHYDDFKSGDHRGNVAAVLCAVLGIFDPETWRLGVFRK